MASYEFCVISVGQKQIVLTLPNWYIRQQSLAKPHQLIIIKKKKERKKGKPLSQKATYMENMITRVVWQFSIQNGRFYPKLSKA